MSSQILISASDVSKKFCRSLKRSLWYGLQDIAGDFCGLNRDWLRLRNSEFLATDRVSFEVRRGECLGLIGRNGAGKTTLLKMINGLIKPDGGRISVRGRVAALIALGAGFNPILSGRENIYINGSILGLSKREIDEKIEEIIDFSEIREFIDAPVQTYSSGMSVRLGFSIATALDPDVLLLDEVLAVGDQSFRSKCFNVIGELKKRAAIIFVSHNMGQISLACDRVIYLASGATRFLGDCGEGLQRYQDDLACESTPETNKSVNFNHPVSDATFYLSNSEVPYGGVVRARVEVVVEEPMPDVHVRYVIADDRGVGFADWSSKRLGFKVELERGRNEISLGLGPLCLRPGRYWLSVTFQDETGLHNNIWTERLHELKVTGCVVGGYLYQLDDSGFELVHHEP